MLWTLWLVGQQAEQYFYTPLNRPWVLQSVPENQKRKRVGCEKMLEIDDVEEDYFKPSNRYYSLSMITTT